MRENDYLSHSIASPTLKKRRRLLTAENSARLNFESPSKEFVSAATGDLTPDFYLYTAYIDDLVNLPRRVEFPFTAKWFPSSETTENPDI
jgi:hypothetical protein